MLHLVGQLLILLLNIYVAIGEQIEGTHANPGINVTAVSQYIVFILVIIITQLPVHAYLGYENNYCVYTRMNYSASYKLWFTQRENIFVIWFPLSLVIYFCFFLHCVDIFNPSCHLESSLLSWPVILRSL